MTNNPSISRGTTSFWHTHPIQYKNLLHPFSSNIRDAILPCYVLVKYSFPDSKIIAWSTQIEYHMTRHFRQLFFSIALCQPNCSYNMNRGNGRRMLQIESWKSFGGLERYSLSFWIKIDKQNKRIILVMKTTAKYNQATNLSQNLLYSAMRNSCSAKAFFHWVKCPILRYVLFGNFWYQKASICWFTRQTLPVVFFHKTCCSGESKNNFWNIKVYSKKQIKSSGGKKKFLKTLKKETQN